VTGHNNAPEKEERAKVIPLRRKSNKQEGEKIFPDPKLMPIDMLEVFERITQSLSDSDEEK